MFSLGYVWIPISVNHRGADIYGEDAIAAAWREKRRQDRPQATGGEVRHTYRGYCSVNAKTPIYSALNSLGDNMEKPRMEPQYFFLVFRPRVWIYCRSDCVFRSFSAFGGSLLKVPVTIHAGQKIISSFRNVVTAPRVECIA